MFAILGAMGGATTKHHSSTHTQATGTRLSYGASTTLYMHTNRVYCAYMRALLWSPVETTPRQGESTFCGPTGSNYAPAC